jgi:hypothetical protein
VALAWPVSAQEAGWHYSPLPGEGDRAAMGCGYAADAQEFTCLVVRCEDDHATGLHIHTSRPGGDAGRWRIDIDKDSYEVRASASEAPYGARVEGDVATLIDGLRNGAVAYLDPLEGDPVSRNGISLSGSLYVVNQALYFCAPRVPPQVEEPAEP